MSAAVALVRLHRKVERTVTLVGQVMRKFPRETVPDRYRPFYDLRTFGQLAMRAGTRDSNDIIVMLQGKFGGLGTGSIRIPEKWLNLQESQLAALVRREYWASRQKQLHEASRQAESDLSKARQDLLSAQAAVERSERAAAAARSALTDRS